MFDDTMTMEDKVDHVTRGFTRAATFIAGFLTLALLIVGLDALKNPSNARSGTVGAEHPIVLGSCLVAIATVIIVLTLDRWVKALPGLLAYSIIGGLLAIADGGFRSYITSLSVSRNGVILFTALMVINCWLSFTFARRALGLVDRIALLIFLYSLVLTMISGVRVMFAAAVTGTVSLLLAALIHRIGTAIRNQPESEA